MGFGEAVTSALNKYATFSGRARRAEYWWFQLFAILVGFAAGLLDALLFGASTYRYGNVGLLYSLASLALLLPGLAVWCRRVHDVGRSGWWWLLCLVPVVGWIVLFYWAIRRGDEGDNAYGSDPITRSADYGMSDIPRVPRK